MPEVIISDYFYGDEAQMFQYFRIPRQLITDDRFKHISTDAKLLYGMLLDRMSLSAKNEWYDDDGRIYIYYMGQANKAALRPYWAAVSANVAVVCAPVATVCMAL